MSKLTTLSTIHNLEDRYPFNEEELEILVRCHDKICETTENRENDFLMKMALASPYSYFFLPGCEMRTRVNWIEDHILPPGFSNELRAAMTCVPFVEYANQGEDKPLERFLEGVASTGRRGAREALGALYEIVGDREEQEEELMDCVIRLAVANEALMAANLDKEAVLKHVNEMEPIKESMGKALKEAHGTDKPLTKKEFIEWAENHFSLLSAPLSAFVHNLLFHGHAHPKGRNMLPYVAPKIEHASDIFSTDHSPLLTALSFITPSMGGKWHRLYSSEMDGKSFNRLEWSLLGYAGPTLLMVKTTEGATLGGFTGVPWHEDKKFFGNTDCFLVELEPKVAVHHAIGTQDHFMYLHSEFFHSHMQPEGLNLPHGIGFGGTSEKPRLFIPSSFEGCTAAFLDKTFESGELLAPESLEQFEIKYLEIWGVGGDETIVQALRERAEYRERTDTAIMKARIVQDKRQFANDMKSGLIPNDVFSHQEYTRGRQDFQVDEEHGGYRVEKEHSC